MITFEQKLSYIYFHQHISFLSFSLFLILRGGLPLLYDEVVERVLFPLVASLLKFLNEGDRDL